MGFDIANNCVLLHQHNIGIFSAVVFNKDKNGIWEKYRETLWIATEKVVCAEQYF